ncbi:phosphatidylserine decarboxylase [Gordonia insulae]|uniref:phosphatidylserine decarboxylase n=1 Tax=Gordonia insulae TaxID=2420509 RepID=UPI000F5BC30E|nr:phosphatidylserine decarboxylase [Gordonia insulae]
MARRPRPDGSRSGAGHLVDLARETIPPVHKAGLPFVAAPAAVAILGRHHPWIARPAALTAGACAAFFRHPKRVPPTAAGAVVAPADGTISLVDEAVPPVEAELGDAPLPRVSTFLSIFDVHVQRVPIAGRVTAVTHTAGSFVSADLPEASSVNERTTMVLNCPVGADTHDVAVVQIAGLLARRIVCEPTVGDDLTTGDTYGLIRFGSRVDVYLPAGTVPQVRVGQRAVGAETVFATLT